MTSDDETRRPTRAGRRRTTQPARRPRAAPRRRPRPGPVADPGDGGSLGSAPPPVATTGRSATARAADGSRAPTPTTATPSCSRASWPGWSATAAGRSPCGCGASSPGGPSWSATRSPTTAPRSRSPTARLVVRTDSTAWATQLKLLTPTVVRRLNEELGHGTVPLIEVLGPAPADVEEGPAVHARRPRTARHLRLRRGPAVPAAAESQRPPQPICGAVGRTGTRSAPQQAVHEAPRGL